MFFHPTGVENAADIESYPDDDLLGGVRHDRIVAAVAAVSVQTDDQVEVPLIRVRLTLFAHVVGRRLAEVQPADGHLGHLVRTQIDSARKHQVNPHITKSCNVFLTAERGAKVSPRVGIQYFTKLQYYLKHVHD